jgi:hypothetical protein
MSCKLSPIGHAAPANADGDTTRRRPHPWVRPAPAEDGCCR